MTDLSGGGTKCGCSSERDHDTHPERHVVVLAKLRCQQSSSHDETRDRQIEASHENQFVAIEPISGEYFLGATLSDAIGASRRAHPGRLAHAFRVGHKAAVHFGLQIR